MLDDLQLNSILEDFDVSYWKVDSLTKKISWSPHFHNMVGHPSIHDDVFNYFIQNILHKDYRYDFRAQFEELMSRPSAPPIEFRMQLNNGKYRWFKCRRLVIQEDASPDQAILLFVNIHQAKRDEYTIEENFFYYRETAEMTTTGGWYMDLTTKNMYWDNITKKILESPIDYEPGPQDKLRFYAPGYKEKTKSLLEKCARYGTPFKAELKMLTFHNREFWGKMAGKPVYNQNQEITGIRGVFQDIDKNKTNEINLQTSLDLIAAQNSRLFNFSHIVSHDLRSHSSNLSLIAQLLQEAKSPEDKLQLLENIQDISNNIESAIRNLNEIVANKKELEKEYRKVKFSEALEVVLSATSSLINRENAQIVANFDTLNEILYIPEYLESIFLNLVTNAIKYRQKNRRPVIVIQSYTEAGNNYLEVSDNGCGIDLDKYRDKIFGMYQTFHNHPEAKGIGLFITKNQVEVMGGSISVSSTVDIGTTFTIKF